MDYSNYPKASFEVLQGKTITKIEGMELNSKEIRFRCSDGSIYVMYHEQDCCEYVRVDDIVGDVKDLIGSEILQAKVKTNHGDSNTEYDVSYTWTFYSLATIKGYVDLKWLGESNGYYSEEVSFVDISKK